MITSLLAPVAALVLLRGSAGVPAFVLVLAGLAAFVAGPVLVSRFSVEPVYDVLLGWKADSPPEDWREARDRYFRLNVIRGLGSGGGLRSFPRRSGPALAGQKWRCHESQRDGEQGS